MDFYETERKLVNKNTSYTEEQRKKEATKRMKRYWQRLKPGMAKRNVKTINRVAQEAKPEKIRNW